MFRLDDGLKVYLHREAVDFRKNINGLAALVQQALGLNPFAACVYVFSNRRRDRVKVLGWDRNGFWLLLKRLEEDRFIWPSETEVPVLTVEQLHWLLEGIDIEVLTTGGLGGLFFSVPNARFVHRQVLNAPRLSDVVTVAAGRFRSFPARARATERTPPRSEPCRRMPWGRRPLFSDASSTRTGRESRSSAGRAAATRLTTRAFRPPRCT